MTNVEKARFRHNFPLLNVEGEIVTDEASISYNCIAWTVNCTDRWLWPGDDKQNFDAFYSLFGCFPTDDGPIALFENITNGSVHKITHGSKIGFNGWFESKCGEDLRILHILEELQNSSYGYIVGYYSPVKHSVKSDMLKLTNFERQKIQMEAAKVSLKDREKFQTLFKEWKDLWLTDEPAFLSDPYTRAENNEFERLVEMGTESIPLVIEALAEPDNFFAISLYERLQQDTRLCAKINPNSPEVLQGEQSRAIQVIRKWLER
jgi:hypothetical protein